MKILVISDHVRLSRFVECKISQKSDHDLTVVESSIFDIEKDRLKTLIDDFDVIWSVHCKCLFPKWLTESKKCLNIHPGFNPHNRGHAPHVFSIINGLPAGVTVHHINNTVDNGEIIYREELKVKETDTSCTLYENIISLEEYLLGEHFDEWSSNEKSSVKEKNKIIGNINSRKEYADLMELDMDSTGTLREHINLLRALTHTGYDNAYFLDHNEQKVCVSIKFKSGC